MKRDQEHRKNTADLTGPAMELFSRADVPWNKSKDAVWEEISAQLHEEGGTELPIIRFLPGKKWLALAASLTLLIAVTSFLRFYTKTTATSAEEYDSLQLPDGSRVELNEHTSISYHPYWWRIARTLQLEGEAWFEVENGARFKVLSAYAATEVLGTTFNVVSRDLNYQVICRSGKVKVSSKVSKSMVILTPDEQVYMDESGKFDVISLHDKKNAPDWKNNQLMFVATPLRIVFDEIERQYGITIVTSGEFSHLYSGNFTLDGAVEIVLDLLCRPFDLTYEHTSESTYHIYQVPR